MSKEVCDCPNPDTCHHWIPKFPKKLNNYEKTLIIFEKGPHREDDVVIDLQTANAMKTIYENLSDKNKEKFMQLDFVVLAHKCWDIIGSASKST